MDHSSSSERVSCHPPSSLGTLSSGSQLMEAARRNPLSHAFFTLCAKASSAKNSKSATIWPSPVLVSLVVRPMGSPPEGDLPTPSWAHMTTGFLR